MSYLSLQGPISCSGLLYSAIDTCWSDHGAVMWSTYIALLFCSVDLCTKKGSIVNSYRVSENGQFTIVTIEGVVKVMMYSLLYLGLFLHKILPAILTEMLCLKKRALVYCFLYIFILIFLRKSSHLSLVLMRIFCSIVCVSSEVEELILVIALLPAE